MSDGNEAAGGDVRGLDPWGLRRVERLLHSVEGVDSLKVVPDGQGGIDEIHVLSSSDLGGKQIVRNIESALLAQFGLQIDHRKISVAQVTPRDLPPSPAEEETVAPPPSARRALLTGIEVERRAGERVLCRVTLQTGDETHQGEAEGPDHAQARFEVAARATLEALTASLDSSSVILDLTGVAEIQLLGRGLMVALVQGRAGRRTVGLPGIALVSNSEEEASVLACLNATNRWIGSA